jgi:hypothetical protein
MAQRVRPDLLPRQTTLDHPESLCRPCGCGVAAEHEERNQQKEGGILGLVEPTCREIILYKIYKGTTYL